MTGFDYTAAVHMLYEGMVDEGLAIIAAIRDRYDGRKRSPFNEAECGHHYARAMASWGAILALTGFHYSGVTHTMTFAPLAGTNVWSTGDAWGTCTQEETADGILVTLEVLFGNLSLQRLTLRGKGAIVLPAATTLQAGGSFTAIASDDGTRR
jgi:hypothetical protein